MATGITTYATLLTEFAAWIARADLTARVDTFIQLAEAQFNRELRVRQMVINGTVSISTATTALPTGFQEAINLELSGSPVIPLRYVTTEQMEMYDLGTSTGQPRLFTISGSNLIVAPAPNATFTGNLDYYQTIPTLVNGTNTSNWLLLAYPDAYLYGILCAACMFASDDRYQTWFAALEKVKADIIRADEDANYSGSVIRLRPDAGW